MITVTVSDPVIVKVPFYAVSRIETLQDVYNWKWWQHGECKYFNNGDDWYVGITVISIQPIIGNYTVLHELGHLTITTHYLNQCMDADIIPSMDKIQELNDTYDKWNWHGLLFWRH